MSFFFMFGTVTITFKSVPQRFLQSQRISLGTWLRGYAGCPSLPAALNLCLRFVLINTAPPDFELKLIDFVSRPRRNFWVTIDLVPVVHFPIVN